MWRRKAKRPEPIDERDRGREAEKPSEIQAKGWKDIFKRTRKELNEDNMSLVAAGVAFFALVGLVPALAALISIYGLIADPQQVEQHFSAISGILPGAVSDLLSQQMKRIASNTTAAGVGAAVGILLALWSASSAIKKLIIGLNIAYDEEEKRGFFKITFVTLMLTFVAVLVALLGIAAIVALPIILKTIGLGDNELLVHAIRWPLLAFIALLGFAFLYRFGPSRAKPKWRWVTWGSTIAMILWVLGSAAFSFYVSHFGKYNETYGSLGAIVIVLMWMYLSAYVVLIGAEVNSEIEKQTARDTTTDREKPRGQRGATAADDLGEAYA